MGGRARCAAARSAHPPHPRARPPEPLRRPHASASTPSVPQVAAAQAEGLPTVPPACPRRGSPVRRRTGCL
eukprot:7177476-Prymnesium_polylepis.1